MEVRSILDNFDKELKKEFKKSFDDLKLSCDYLNSLEVKISKEEEFLNTKRGKLYSFLNKEIEIDIRFITVACLIFLTISTTFSIKGLNETPEVLEISAYIK